MSSLVRLITRSITGRIILVSILLVTTAYVTRLYYVDLPATRERELAAVGESRLEAMGDALEAAASRDSETLAKSLPERTEWHPAALACDAEAKFGPAPHPVWEVLGVKPEEETSFQYRFDQNDGTYEIRARRDRDCDGIFAVWNLEGSTDWTALIGRSQSAQNIGE